MVNKTSLLLVELVWIPLQSNVMLTSAIHFLVSMTSLSMTSLLFTFLLRMVNKIALQPKRDGSRMLKIALAGIFVGCVSVRNMVGYKCVSSLLRSVKLQEL